MGAETRIELAMIGLDGSHLVALGMDGLPVDQSVGVAATVTIDGPTGCHWSR